MPKVSQATAVSHQAIPGYMEAYEQKIGDWTVSIERFFTDMDMAPFFKGAPNDQCQSNHVGYVLKGKFGARRADGVEEIYEAGATAAGPTHASRSCSRRNVPKGSTDDTPQRGLVSAGVRSVRYR